MSPDVAAHDLQGCNYACAITTVDGASIFAAGSDRKLKHMQARCIVAMTRLM